MKKAITACNILGAEEYKKQVEEVLGFVGKTVSRTLGPCANTSIIEEFGPLTATKDGFHTICNIKVAPEDTFATQILKVIVQMSQRMVSIVGDGSTSACVAAWKFANEFLKSEMKNTRPRDLNLLVQNTINALCEEIEKKAIRPTKEDLADVMYKTALVSANGDTTFANLIKEVYTQVGEGAMFNVIRDDRSNRQKTSYQVVDGYKAGYYYMIDPVFYNVDGGFIGKGVHVIVFDMALTAAHYGMIHRMAQLAHQRDANKQFPNEVIVVAPSYDQHLCDKIANDTRMDQQYINAKNIRHFQIRYVKALAVDAYQRNEYMDFCMLAGSAPIAAVDFNAMVDPIAGTENFDDDRLNEAIGYVDSFESRGNDYTIIKGYPKMNKDLFDKTMSQVETVYNKLAADNLTAPYPSKDFIKTRQRYRKLLCKTVDVFVGAPNPYERSVIFDAYEDATRACESVVSFGYNIGGNMAIIFAIDDRLNGSEVLSAQEVGILNVLRRTFIGVIEEVFANAYTSSGFDSLDDTVKKEIDGIIDTCCKDRTYYDLIEQKFTNDIVNSSHTDTEILRGALSVCLSLLTSNQYFMQIPIVKIEN